jgi:hypothetical protein
MNSSLYIVLGFAALIVFAYLTIALQSKKRIMRKWDKQRKALQAKENQEKEILNISLYEDAAGKGKLQKGFKWDLHESI